MVSAKQVIQLLLHPTDLRALINYKIWHEPLRRLEDDLETSRYDQPTMKRCYELLDHSSRSFAMVIKELEAELGRVVCIFYLVLRALDTIEDDMTLDIELKEKLLTELHLKLDDTEWNFTGSGPNEKDKAVLVDFQVIRHEFSLLAEGYRLAIQDIARMMGKGMAKYARIAADNPSTDYQVNSMADFDVYCHYVAGLVGEGLSRLFAASGREDPELPRRLSLSNSMGLMLQKNNIMRDFAEDLRDGRLFWPKDIWGKYVNDPKDFWDDSIEGIEEKRTWALNEMCFDALRHSLDCLNYLTLIKRQSVFNFCAIPQV
ncbi:farnesyl-diphosphate farnesyltransferase, partial [Atractiella rhizophila]